MKYIRTKDGRIIDTSKYDDVDINANHDITLVDYMNDVYLIIKEEEIDEIH